MTFQELNMWVQSAPEPLHWITSAFILAMYAQLSLAYYATFNVLSKPVKFFFPIAHLIMISYFFAKLSSNYYGTMLDIFFPTYIIYYISMVIVIKARYFRCFSNVKGFFKFTWHQSVNHKKSKA